MRIKSKKIKFILMMIIASGILFASKAVYGISISNPPAEPYQYNSNLFCVDNLKGWYVENVLGLDSSSIVDNYSEEDRDIEASIGFAFYSAMKTGTWDSSSATLQQIIWASGQFKDKAGYQGVLAAYAGQTTSPTASNGLIARSNQYAQFYYGILKGQNKITLNTTTKDSKVLVDQISGTYTVGPYSVDVDADLSGSTSEAKTILYNELAGINKVNYPNYPAFANAEVTGIEGEDIEFLDKSGNTIQFPNWGEEFYIRFKPTNGITTINPKVTIYYLNKISGKVKYCVGSSETFSGNVSGIDVKESDFKAENYVNSGTLKANGNFGASIGVKILSTKVTTERRQVGTQPKDPNDPSQGTEPIYENYVTGFSYTAEITDPNRIQELIYVSDSLKFGLSERTEDLKLGVGTTSDKVDIELGLKEISMELGGNVWLDLPEVKTGNITGVRSEEDTPYAGMLVRLYDKNGNLVGTTVTDSNGSYHFKGLNPLMKYYVRFTYNGQVYQATYYKNQLTGGYSNAEEEARENFNSKFGKIDSTTQNYKVGNEWHTSYALLAKLEKDDGSFIAYGDGALTYEDAWNKFVELAAQKGSYESAYQELDSYLASLGVGSKDRAGVITFIKDCMIDATTHVTDPLTNKLVEYPVYDRFVLENLENPTDEIETITLGETYSYLYTKKSDQSRYVDFGITRRQQEELYLQKDVYKATVIVNGKKHEYNYSKKDLSDDGSWNVEVRASDELYNGSYTYTREVRKSEYLYSGKDAGTSSSKDLQVYVTYRLAIKNRSQSLYSTINEIVDYYDADQYTFDGILGSNGVYSLNSYNNYDENGNVTGSYVNSYVGNNANGGKLENAELTVSNNTSFADRSAKTLSNGQYTYNSLYITGIKSASGNDRLAPGEFAYAYVTFKVNKDEATGKVKVDQDLNNGNTTVGKRNIAEINGYSTYYSEGAVIPGHLNADNSTVDVSVGNKTAGIIDTISNAGNLTENDLTSDGDIKYSKDDPVQNRAEPDTDKAPNIKLVIKTGEDGDDETRRLTGYVYEDNRTVMNDSAVVGNGKYDNDETKINGVKVELVELVQNVDDNGIFVGSYSGEKVWGTATYKFEGGKLVKDGDEDLTRYFSGKGQSKVILTGPGILEVLPDELGENNGTYSFKSVPTGDFIIRFTYGDTTQTVLTSEDNDVNKLLGQKGLNVKSYNGQDYKSTTYQPGISQDSSYNGIQGFVDYEKQNYTNATDKSTNYYYDIAKSATVQGASDAKDVYSYREKVNSWSQGASYSTLLNNRAEIMNSFESTGTYTYKTEDLQKQAQQAKIDGLIANTQMVAQTGVIDTEVEYNSKETSNQGKDNKLTYTIGDIDLGLQERPEAQLKLNKEITSLKLTLANGQILFDTHQSVNNLYFAKHEGHSIYYDNKYNNLRLKGYKLGKNNKQTPELIQAYLDEELIAGAQIEAVYKFTVTNVGEVDYLDKQFYYIGKSAHAGDTSYMSTTNAKQVIDYVSNYIKYDKNVQDVNANWQVKTQQEIMPSVTLTSNGTLSLTGDNITIDETKLDEDLINRQYADKLATYNTVLTTDKLSEDLLPAIVDNNKSQVSTSLVLSALLSNSTSGDNFVYNNLSEIVATSNKQGRRMVYSVSGNQEMADQSLGSNARDDLYTPVDLVTPTEVDSDSSQKIVIMPPTGADKNYIPVIATVIAVASIIIAGIVIIKKKIIK